MGKSSINSHIQMPKFLLKRFEDEEKRFFCYDIKDQSIRTSNAESINTGIGYFSEAVEKILNQSIEQPFSSLLRYIDTINFDANSFVIKRGFVRKTKSFLYALLARNPIVYEKIRKISIYTQFLDQQSQHDISVITAIKEAEKLAILDEYYPTFTVNKSNTPFVLPLCGFYWMNKCINLPIDPKHAITMVNKEKLEEIIDKDTIHMYLVTKESEADRLNYFAYQEQRRQGYGNIISSKEKPIRNMLLPRPI